MKLRSLLIILCSFFLVPILNVNAQEEHWCGFDEILAKEKAANPNYMMELAEKVKDIRLNAATNFGSRSTTYIVPVVFHVIHDGGPGNISMEQIQSGIDVMNEDFNALNADSTIIRNDTSAPFLDLFANVDVEFRLAKLDPNGNCTNGVERVYAPHLTNDAGEDCKYSSNGGLDAWPNNRYINIWTVNSISGSGQGTTLGYAFLPYNNWGSGHGILNRHDRVGRVGTAASNGGRTLTHEMGHICGLLHTFQNDCHSSDCENNGDFVCDTPPSEQIWGCNSSLNSCTDVPVNDHFGVDVFDQVENHMSYSSCRRMYSEGQKELMHNVFTQIPNFVSITSQSNLDATGVLLPDVMCDAEFYADRTVICSGEAVQFFDDSYHGQTEWSWSFPGGSPSTSTQQNPAITYNTPGVYEVQLTASDGTNSETEVKTAYITVVPDGSPLPYFEGFENFNTIPNAEWSIITGAFSNWGIGSVGLSGDKSAQLSNFNADAGSSDYLISPLIDLSTITDAVTLSFRFAYRKRNSDNNEQLFLSVSNGCGDDWSVRRVIQGNLLGNEVESSNWEPDGPEDWTTIHVTNITSQFWVDKFRFRFQFDGDGGNNFFVDDINIYAGEESDELILNAESIAFDNMSFSVFPNPAEDFVNIEFSLDQKQKVNFEIVNAQGQLVQSNKIMANEGNNKVILDTEHLSTGIYYLKGYVDGFPLATKKISIK
jgi:PKD repeat protein